MSSRRCSGCLQSGHNITRCTDENARSVMNRILNSDMNTAVSLVDTISNNLVSFVLVQGYHLSVRLNRSALRTRVIQDYNQRNQPDQVPVVNRRPIPNILRPDIIYSANIMNDALNIATLHHQTSQNVRNYYASRPESATRVCIYVVLVRGYLRRLEDAARAQSYIEFNRYISLRLCISIATACPSINQILQDDEIRHVDNLARMYNYERLLENSNTFETMWPSVMAAAIKPPDQMKVLPIKITVCEPCHPEDTCGVCFDELPSEKMVKTGCGHTYCSTCIAGVAHQRGLKSFIPCPGCRADIVELKVYNEEEHQLVVDGLKPV